MIRPIMCGTGAHRGYHDTWDWGRRGLAQDAFAIGYGDVHGHMDTAYTVTCIDI